MIEKEILEYIFVCVDYKHKNDISPQITKSAIDKENLLFEKAVNFLRNLDTENKVFLKVSEQTEKLTQDLIQAEFGYNKANEWHYVKDGDLPKDEDYKLCISSNDIPYVARYEELFVSWTNQEHKEVCCPYAWKEIVPPKELAE